MCVVMRHNSLNKIAMCRTKIIDNLIIFDEEAVAPAFPRLAILVLLSSCHMLKAKRKIQP